MARVSDRQPTYDAIGQVVEVAFHTYDSLFTPRAPIWSREQCDDLYERFVERPDTSHRTFLEKFKDQLATAPPATLQFAAELLFVQLITPVGIGQNKKIETVETVLNWSAQPVPLSDEYKLALAHGLSNDQSFLNARPSHLAFLLEVLRKWHRTPESDQRELLADPWAFKEFLQDVPDRAGQPMREILYHMVFPDVFEPISSRKYKRLIHDAFRSRLSPPTGDIDRDILQIRQTFVTERGENFNFYDPEMKQLWLPQDSPTNLSPWKCFVAWIHKCAATGPAMQKEMDYKQLIGERLRQTRDAVLANAVDWPELLKKAASPPNNLLNWRQSQRLSKAAADNVDAFRSSLRLLWDGNLPAETESWRHFIESINAHLTSGAGERATILSFLLMGIDSELYPIYRAQAFKNAYKLSGYDRLPPRSDAVQTYSFALAFLDALIEESQSWEVPLANRLAAQSAMWIAMEYEKAPPDWSQEEWQRLLAYRQGELGPPNEVESDADALPDDEDVEENQLQQLADALLIDQAYFERLKQLLEDKRQVVLYGPPGTGKTYVAQKFAEHLAGSTNGARIVQFHPSYTYEDFFEGFRPTINNGNAVFQLQAGPLKRIAQAASENPNKTFVLIIDEINRGNLAKIFGELYFLLEYRNHSIELQYSLETLRLPENLRIIGTMNTADRSISLVDAALRRRFYFVEFFPDRPPIQGLLRRWLARHEPGMLWVADVVDAANARLEERHLAIGPSHFMKRGLSEEWVEMIWAHSVVPYLEEHFFGQPDRIDTFALQVLRNGFSADNVS